MMTEDLANTPAERATKLAAARSAPEDQSNAFEATEEVVVGEPGEIIVVGAGLVGSLCAVVLLRKGFKVHIYERYADIRAIPSVGRSINLSVTSRGLRAIKSLGGDLIDRVLSIATTVKGRIIHGAGGGAMFQRYGKDDTECNYAISRVELNKLLINVAEEEGAVFHWDHALSETSDLKGDKLIGCVLNFTVGGIGGSVKLLRVRANCPLIGCDGGGSRLRYAMRRCGLTSFSEDMMHMGYKEVLFPHPGGNDFGAKGGDDGEACPGLHALHIWPAGGPFLMCLPNLDGSFTGTIYMDKTGSEEAFDSFTDTPEGIDRCRRFCEQNYSEAAPLVGGLQSLVEQITKNPMGILGTVRCERWAVKGKAVLIGDACHAMVPFFGQGCNCGFEDTLWLSRLIDTHCCTDGQVELARCTGENFALIFASLEAERKPNAEAICEMAIENAKEMGARTADMKFKAMKKVENRLENKYKELFRSRYAMVCYGGEGNVSYANARKLGMVQEQILSEVCEGTESLGSDEDAQKFADALDLDLALKLLQERLVPLQKELGIDLETVKH